MENEQIEAEELDQAVEHLMDEIAESPQANGIHYNIAALHNIGVQ